MLFVLTGRIQTGKTRWIQRLVREVERRGGICDGVVAPGDWRTTYEEDGEPRYEKRGIFNEILPSHERVLFAQRRDLVEMPCEGEESLGLGWAFRQEALRRVNAGFERMAESEGAPSLLVVDEVGRLELTFGTGLTSAMRLLELGPTVRHPVALTVVREDLLSSACDRFAEPWGKVRIVAPNEDALGLVIGMLEARGVCPHSEK